MSFLLPGNERQLRFSGEAKVLEPEVDDMPPTALGRPRVRRASIADTGSPSRPPAPTPMASSLSAPPRSIRTPVNARPREEDVKVPSMAPVAASSVRRKLGELSSRWPGANALRRSLAPSDEHSTRGRAALPDDEDDNPTRAITREAFDARPGAPSSTVKPVEVMRAASIPHFRMPAPDARTAVIARAPSAQPQLGGRAPLAVWIVASIVAGLVSYHVAPEIMARLDPPAHAAER